ncbi:hypothetical protein JOQ06_010808 [Pogonophryne albipinna]|uniref:Ran-GTPase activating protein 1 C-terminal domain-containing protein n=1 Tax=Pogonophryne albipinna TaxID=1090488 RepID=A0AAD6AW00_9TELE|nr:hypothetical protein JOQ06_010808 [Pogonophryne albipinna]
MATDIVAQLAESLAKTGVEDGELSYKGQGRKLDDAQSVEEIVKEIQDFEDLQALRLEGNTIGVAAAQAIAKALETKSKFKRCYWSDMFTGRLRSEIPPALNSLGDALMLANARLTVLDLSDNAFGPDGVKGIERLLKSTACYTLQELRLNNCGMGIGGGKILAAALIQCYKTSSAEGTPLGLKAFVAGRNRLENEGATALAQAFKLMGSLEEINVPQNGINHPGVTAMAGAGAIAMAQALKHLRSIQVINFGDCLVRPAGAIAIAETVSEGLPILKELNLSFGEITEEAALAVVHAVKNKHQLEKLDLNGNCLGEDGCKVLKDAMEGMNIGDILGSLSNGIKLSTPASAPRPPDVSSFLSFPSPDKLLKLGAKRALLIEQQVDVSDASKTAEAFLKIASVYKEENNDVKIAVLDSIDALLKKAFATPSFQGYSFVSSLLVLLGLLKSEDKVKPVVVVPGHLHTLEHVVRQDYFPKENVAVLEAFLSRNNNALESCGNARDDLQSTLQRVRSEG